jgi:hypothetical protein
MQQLAKVEAAITALNKRTCGLPAAALTVVPVDLAVPMADRRYLTTVQVIKLPNEPMR